MSAFGEAKRRMRADVHKTFAVSARYRDATMGVPVDITVRWHSRFGEFGDLAEQHYAEMVDNVDRLIFDRLELLTLGITPRQGATVVITEAGWDNATLVLQIADAKVGPTENIWQVARGKL